MNLTELVQYVHTHGGGVVSTIGGRDGTSLQCEGVAEVLGGADLTQCADAYYSAFPQFTRSSGDDIAFVRVRLAWARYGQYVDDAFESSEVDLTT